MDVSQGQKGRCLVAPGAKKRTGKQGLARGGEAHNNKRKEKPEKEQNPLPGKFPVTQCAMA